MQIRGTYGHAGGRTTDNEACGRGKRSCAHAVRDPQPTFGATSGRRRRGQLESAAGGERRRQVGAGDDDGRRRDGRHRQVRVRLVERVRLAARQEEGRARRGREKRVEQPGVTHGDHRRNDEVRNGDHQQRGLR